MAETLSDQHQKEFQVITQKSYKDQSCFFLNAFWKDFEEKTEDIWKMYKKFLEIDRQQYNGLPKDKRAENYTPFDSLDEFWSHKYLESYGKTLTALEFRNEFKKIDANFDKRMSFIEFLIWEYKISIKEMMMRPQGADAGEILKAQELLDQVASACNEAQKALDQATATEKAAEHAERAAVESENRARSAAEAAKKTEDAAKAAVNDLKAQENAYAAKTADLTAKAEAGGVAGMRAKNELAQHQAEDPLPLRKAKLGAEAAAKKTEKAKQEAANSAAAAEKSRHAAEDAAASAEKDRMKAEDAASAAAADRAAAEHATAAAKHDRKLAEDAVREAQEKLAEAEAFLEEQKRKGSGDKKGTFWWLDRELRERKEYMPKTGSAKLLF